MGKAFAIAVLAACASTAGQAALARRLETRMAGESASGFSGSVLVARKGAVVLDRGYGWADRARTRRVTPRTRFWIASISKQFTAAAILKLAEDGRLSVDDPLGRHLPGVPDDKRVLTLHQLLTHTAGLRQRYAADGIVEREAALRALLAPPLASVPGERFAYSNDAYNLLAIVVEAVSGQPFERFVQTRLLDPAGLTDTGFWGQAGHESVAEMPNPVEGQPRYPNWGFRGATGMYSSSSDLYRWQRALRGNRVLSEASRTRLQAPHVPIEDGAAAYGWFLTTGPGGTRALWTRGTESFGHNAIIMTYPDPDVVIVAASNAGDHGGVAMARWLADELAPVVLGPVARTP